MQQHIAVLVLPVVLMRGPDGSILAGNVEKIERFAATQLK
jgi:hypothetical protein